MIEITEKIEILLSMAWIDIATNVNPSNYYIRSNGNH
jgi:hypothetical protein